MKRDANLIFPGGADDISVNTGQNVHILPGAFNKWGPDKGHGNIFFGTKVTVGMDASKLPPISVSTDSDRESSKISMIIIGKLFCQKNQAGAGGQYREAVTNLFL